LAQLLHEDETQLSTALGTTARYLGGDWRDDLYLAEPPPMDRPTKLVRLTPY
jgi:hypothetical protein